MMTETVVHVTTLGQWKSVLDVWFKQGYAWSYINGGYMEELFNKGSRQLGLNVNGEHEISYWSHNGYKGKNIIEYSDFMAQQKEDNKMETYYVTQEQLDLIVDLKKGNWPLARLVNSEDIFIPLNNGLEMVEEKAILRYLGGDETIDFKAKKQLYRLWRIDDEGDTVYMKFSYGTPGWAVDGNRAFTAPLEEIKKWKTPAWEVEQAD